MSLVAATGAAWALMGGLLLVAGAAGLLAQQAAAGAARSLRGLPDLVFDSAQGRLRVSTAISGAPQGRALAFACTDITGLRLVELPRRYRGKATIQQVRLEVVTIGNAYRPVLRVEGPARARQLGAVLGQLLQVPVHAAADQVTRPCAARR